MRQRQLRAVLFDLGETLLDVGGATPDYAAQSRRDLREVYDYVCEQGHPAPPWEAFHDTLSGLLFAQWRMRQREGRALDVAAVLREGISALGLSLSPDELAECLRHHFRSSDESAVLYPDVLPTLHALRAAGWTLGLISNSIWPASCHDETLARLGIRDLFAVRLYSADVGYQKPHPAIFRQALAALQLTPAEAVYVGDRLDADIAGAHAVGMRGILRVVPYRVEANGEIVPDARIEMLAELPALLARWSAAEELMP